jgi:hypothetical protein
VGHAIDEDRASRWRGESIEPEEGEDAVDVHEQCGMSGDGQSR